jgi:hypothetical protein
MTDGRAVHVVVTYSATASCTFTGDAVPGPLAFHAFRQQHGGIAPATGLPWRSGCLPAEPHPPRQRLRYTSNCCGWQETRAVCLSFGCMSVVARPQKIPTKQGRCRHQYSIWLNPPLVFDLEKANAHCNYGHAPLFFPCYWPKAKNAGGLGAEPPRNEHRRRTQIAQTCHLPLACHRLERASG